ncbi:MAG: hypothetical protein OXB84_04875, partial [Halobacteriovoraceae bacterium]|nr:hypothetical protein [Halobacteriovoraceae bacterium]
MMTGCSSDPYQDLELSEQRGELPYVVSPSYGIDGDKTISFAEGKKSSYYYHLSVPGDGEPVLEIINAPEEGFYYDKSVNKIIWEPSFGAANNPFNDMKTEKSYEVILRLRSTTDNSTYFDKSITVVVQDRPRKLEIQGEDKLEIMEGIPFRYPFRIINEDFPSGVHRVFFSSSFENSVLGTAMQYDDTDVLSWNIHKTLPMDFLGPNKEELKFLCDKSVDTNCTCTEKYGCSLSHKLKMMVVAPNGHKVEKKINLLVNEQRMPPIVHMTEDLAIQEDTLFYFKVSDPNREVVPFINVVDEGGPHILDYPKPGLKRFVEENVSIEVEPIGSFEAVVFVRMRDIPEGLVGRNLNISFGACNHNFKGDLQPYREETDYTSLDRSNSRAECHEADSNTCYTKKKIMLNNYVNYTKFKNCINMDISIPIVSSEYPRPYFLRDLWPRDKTFYIRANHSEIIEFPIYDSKPHDESDLSEQPMVL